MRHYRRKNIYNKYRIAFLFSFFALTMGSIILAVFFVITISWFGLITLFPGTMSAYCAIDIFKELKENNPLLFKTFKCSKCGKKIRPWNKLYIINGKDDSIWANVPPPHWIFCEQCHSVEKLKE